MKNIVLSIDQGTTGSTATLVNFLSNGEFTVLATANFEFPQIYPQAGWVEHDLEEIWQSVKKSITAVIEKASTQINNFAAKQIAAIGITNQRETLAVFDRKTSSPLEKAIVWQCRRSKLICKELERNFDEKSLRMQTGLLWDPYFTGSKLTWLMRARPEIKQKIASGQALWSTIDAFLLYRLTGMKSFVTEPSNASRTLLFDLNKGEFDTDLLRMFEIPQSSILPEVRSSYGHFGKTQGLSFLPDGIPITGVLGDQQAALAGQGCVNLGSAKCTFGTGAFLLVNTGLKPCFSASRLLTTVAWKIKNTTTYALEGSSFIAGAAVQFIRDQLKFIKNSSDIELLASKGIGAPDLFLVPAFVGIGAPHWSPNARAALMGMTRGTSEADICRATLEGIAFLVHDLGEAVNRDFLTGIEMLRVDGGASNNNLLMQIQANLLGVPIFRPEYLEATSLGASFFAALGIGLISDLQNLTELNPVEKTFSPDEKFLEIKKSSLEGWKKAVEAVKLFSTP